MLQCLLLGLLLCGGSGGGPHLMVVVNLRLTHDGLGRSGRDRVHLRDLVADGLLLLLCLMVDDDLGRRRSLMGSRYNVRLGQVHGCVVRVREVLHVLVSRVLRDDGGRLMHGRLLLRSGR